jgi:membrane-bound lytic murein transglycosylase D
MVHILLSCVGVCGADFMRHFSFRHLAWSAALAGSLVPFSAWCVGDTVAATAVAPAAVSAATVDPAMAALAIADSAHTTAPPLNEAQFPRYAGLKPAVGFWTKVFGEYSELQTAIHSSEYPGKIYEVLDFRDEALTMSKPALERYRQDQERQAKARVDNLLRQVNALRATPEKMTAEQRRLFQMYADLSSDRRFSAAIGTFRAQRGLKERTALALATSGSYLPEMESTFGRYQLPLRLTRLPLVESSFNVEAYSKVGAAGLWQFMPSSAKIYMRLNEVVDDRRDPWTSTDAAARHLRDDYAVLKSWPLAVTAYNHGRGGIARALGTVKGSTLMDLIERYDSPRFGFASKNFYAEFLAAVDVESDWRAHFGNIQRKDPVRFEVVETQHYVPYETLRKLCGADDDLFQRLNPAYRPEVVEGKLYVPPGHLIRVPAGAAQSFQVAYAKLGSDELFSAQRVFYLLHKVSKGDSVGKLARQYGVGQAAILSANGLKSASTIRIGQVLKIPPRQERIPGPLTVAVGESKPGLTREETQAVQVERIESAVASAPRKASAAAAYRVHRVKSGQTLAGIAQRYKVSVNDIQSANGLGSSSLIRVGQNLKIPAR